MPNNCQPQPAQQPLHGRDLRREVPPQHGRAAWRWRTELTLITAAAWACWRLATWITLTWSLTVLGVTAAAALAIPHSRRYLARHAWCLVSRHRLQRVCYEARLHTRAGRLPAICWIRPTKVGERAWIVVPRRDLRR